MTREAFGAEFVGAQGFLDTPTYGVPPRFVAGAHQGVAAVRVGFRLYNTQSDADLLLDAP